VSVKSRQYLFLSALVAVGCKSEASWEVTREAGSLGGDTTFFLVASADSGPSGHSLQFGLQCRLPSDPSPIAFLLVTPSSEIAVSRQVGVRYRLDAGPIADESWYPSDGGSQLARLRMSGSRASWINPLVDSLKRAQYLRIDVPIVNAGRMLFRIPLEGLDTA